MDKEHKGDSIAQLLDTPEAIVAWRSDPLNYMENAGFLLSSLDEQSRDVLREYLTHSEVRLFGSIKCLGCKILVGGTFAALSAALVAFVAGLVVVTEGGDAVVAPDEVAAGAEVEVAAVALETGLSQAAVSEAIVTTLRGIVTWAKANPIKAAAFCAASGVAVEQILSAIVEAVCKASNACS